MKEDRKRIFSRPIVSEGMIITFLYRIRGTSVRSYGKYIGRALPLYQEGLDRVVAVDVLLPLFQSLSPQQDLTADDIIVGILFVDREVKDYSSEAEKDVFDVLYCHWPSGVEVFVEGKAVPPPVHKDRTKDRLERA